MKHTHDPAAYVTVTELAEMIGVHRNTVHYWIQQGLVEAKRIGLAPRSPLLISVEEAERVKAKLPAKQQSKEAEVQ